MKKIIAIIILTVTCAGYLFSQEAKNEINFADEQKRQADINNTYTFSVKYGIQVGYLQQWQHSKSTTFPDLYLHGTKFGATFDFCLPYNFIAETGILYSITYGQTTQHWASKSTDDYSEQILTHRILNQQISIPAFVMYKIKLYKQLSLLFYTGPEISVGITEKDYIKNKLNEATNNWLTDKNIHTTEYDRYTDKQLFRTNIQYSLGGAIEWDKYRLQSGYNFGLNNLVRQKTDLKQQMWDWNWHVSFIYQF